MIDVQVRPYVKKIKPKTKHLKAFHRVWVGNYDIELKTCRNSKRIAWGDVLIRSPI